MEHLYDFSILSERTGIIDNSKLLLLIKYADAIFNENKNFNLTGHKSLSDIIENLIIGSLEPIKHLNVPRGTFFADLGSGSGIPGVPISIKYEGCTGTLFDSNMKKIRFINKTVSTLGIDNVSGVDIRIEEAGRMERYREKFDFVFTRAMSDLFTVAELGSPLLKKGGFLYLFINRDQSIINDYLSEHLSSLGLSLENNYSAKYDSGLILCKIKETDPRFPRRMSVIKRLADK